MKSFGFVNYAVLLIYFIALLVIGAHFSKRQKSTEDYFRGQGRVPWWAAGISIFGTMLSAITFMAVPAKAYSTDWSYFMYSMGGIIVAPIIICLFIPFYNRLNVTSAYEYLEKRFNCLTRLLASASFIVFQLGRIAVVLFLPSIAISLVTGVDVMLCITVVGVISVVYTLTGGIEAVIWTDVLQVIVLIGGAVLALITIAFSVDGGVGVIYEVAVNDEKFNLFNADWDFSEPTLWVVVAGGIGASIISYGTDQSVVQRYVTSADLRDSKRTYYTNAAAILPALLLFFSLGTALYVFYTVHPERLRSDMVSDDAILPWYIINELPTGIAGLLIAGIFSAAMSSLSSSINSSSAAYVTDFYLKFRPDEDDKQLLKVARIATFVVGVLGTLFGLWMAISDVKSLWDEFTKVLGLFAGGLGGLFLLGMLTTRASGRGAVAGLVLSGVTQWWIVNYTELHVIIYAATGIASCFVFGYAASLLLSKDSKDLTGLTVWTGENQ